MDEKNTNIGEEQNPFEEKPEKQPRKKKKPGAVVSKRTVSAIYLGIALCMVTVLTVSLARTNRKVENSIDNIPDDFSISVPDISIVVPDFSFPAEDDKPTGGEASGVDGEVVKPEDQEPPKPVVKFVKPVDGEIIKGYYADSLVFSDTMQDFRTHNGVDIAASVGAKVSAYTDGKVSKIENDPFMGTTVEITHSAGVVSVYKNLSEKLALKVGDEVKAGSEIGTVGQSAIVEAADKPHLHFELWMDGKCINSETELKAVK